MKHRNNSEKALNSCVKTLALGLFAVWFTTSAACPAASAASLTRGPYLQLGTSTNIIVRWRTAEPTTSRVRFGLTSKALDWQVSDANEIINHALTLTNLAPNTRYFYRAGTETTDLAAGPGHYFLTAPTNARPTRIWALGDAGTSFNQPDYTGYGLIAEGQRAVRDAYYAHVGSRYTDVWLLLGDNAYNEGRDGNYQTNFFNIYSNTQCRCHGFVDHIYFFGTCLLGTIANGTFFYFGNRGRDTDHHPPAGWKKRLFGIDHFDHFPYH